MIRINLLPIKASRKREYVKQQLILGVVLLAGVLVGLFFWYSAVEKDIKKKNALIAETKSEIQTFKDIIGERDKYKLLEANLQKKKKTIEDLERSKTGPVEALDKFSQLIPKEVWLDKWQEKRGQILLEGEAVSNKHIADFITALKTKGYKSEPGETMELDSKVAVGTEGPQPKRKMIFDAIELKETEMVKLKEFNQLFFKFKISMKVNYAI